MITIYKYSFSVADGFELLIPAQSQFLSLQVQNGVPCIWYRVDTKFESKIHRYIVVGTGHEINPARWPSFLGTFQLFNGGFVGHVFEVQE